MKKFLFAVAALATSLTASAQLWVSGSLLFQNETDWGCKDSRATWGFSPTIGYALDDALEVGLELGITGYNYGKESQYGEMSNIKFSIAPFARYTFLSDGDFSMFAQGKVKYAYGNTKKPVSDPITGDDVTKESKAWEFGFYIEPGIKYALTDNFSIFATLGGLSFTHEDPEKASYGDDQNTFNFNLSTSLNFGLVYSF